MTDDLGRKPVTAVAGRRVDHQPTLPVADQVDNAGVPDRERIGNG
jgi:hypothetical protein